MKIRKHEGAIPKIQGGGKQLSEDTLELMRLARESLTTGFAFDVEPENGQTMKSLTDKLRSLSTKMRDELRIRTRQGDGYVTFWAVVPGSAKDTEDDTDQPAETNVVKFEAPATTAKPRAPRGKATAAKK